MRAGSRWSRAPIRVALASAAVVALETAMFHVAADRHGEGDAMLVLAAAVLGLGAGAFLAGRALERARTGSIATCWLAAATTGALSLFALAHAPLVVALPVASLSFVGPSFIVADAFARHRERLVYVLDMLGVAIGTCASSAVLVAVGVRSRSPSPPSADAIGIAACATTAAVGIAGWLVARGNPDERPIRATLGGYHALTGLGYFVVEIALIDAARPLFASASQGFVLALAALLVGSGAGGLFSRAIAPRFAAGLIAILAPIAIVGPRFLPHTPLVALAFLTIVLATGVALGTFFPRGIAEAKRAGLHDRVPLLYAIGSVSGALAIAIVAALERALGDTTGALAASLLATVLYTAATFALDRSREAPLPASLETLANG